MSKKLIISLLLVSVFIFGLAANGQEEEAAAAVDFGMDAPAEATEIDVMGWTFPITDFYRTQFESLNALENLSVNVQYLTGAEAQNQVRLALSGDKVSPYEIVHAANTQISEWGFPGWLMPLNDLVEKYWDEYDLNDIPQTAWDAATVNGEILGVPAVGNSFQLIYRADLFEKHGIDVPESWDDVIAAAKKLKADEPSLDVPYVTNLHAGWAWEIEFFQMLACYGGEFLNDDNTPAFNGPEGKKALDMLVRIAKEAMGPAGVAYSVDDMEIGLQTGRVAFANTWTSRAVKMNDPAESNFAEEIKFATSPYAVAGGKVAASAWNDFYCIPQNIDVDPEVVFQAIMETVDLESQMEAVAHGITTRQKSAASDKAGSYMEAALAGIAKGAGAYPINPGIPMVRTALAEFLPMSMTGKYTNQEVLDMAAESYLEEATAAGVIK